jgi:DNA-binding phage protein
MAAMTWEDRIQREKGRAVLRALHENELADAGAQRAAAIMRAEEQLDRIARLLPDAIEAGLGITEIARLTGLSRPTLYELRGRYSDSPRDLRIAVLQALMRHETSFPDTLPLHLKRSAAEIRPVIEDFRARGWIEWDIDGGEPREAPGPDGLPFARSDDGVVYPFAVTVAGYEALESWTFADGYGQTETGGQDGR